MHLSLGMGKTPVQSFAVLDWVKAHVPNLTLPFNQTCPITLVDTDLPMAEPQPNSIYQINWSCVYLAGSHESHEFYSHRDPFTNHLTMPMHKGMVLIRHGWHTYELLDNEGKTLKKWRPHQEIDLYMHPESVPYFIDAVAKRA